jgi:hypothetical protein
VTFQTLLETAVSTLERFTSADDVAMFFRRWNVQGKPTSAISCPVARYLSKEAQQLVQVTGSYAHGVGTAHVWLPAPVVRFVLRFDRGHYPDLLEEEMV